jgi:hypothetical protein
MNGRTPLDRSEYWVRAAAPSDPAAVLPPLADDDAVHLEWLRIF